MPRIDPDRVIEHKRHTDHFWPGVIHSVWKWRGWTFQRERVYVDRYHQRLAKTAWELSYQRQGRRGGLRYEVDAPDQGRLS